MSKISPIAPLKRNAIFLRRYAKFVPVRGNVQLNTETKKSITIQTQEKVQLDNWFQYRMAQRRVAIPWRRRLVARLPRQGGHEFASRSLHVDFVVDEFVWVVFPRGFSSFPQPLILFHHFSTLISIISFHFI